MAVIAAAIFSCWVFELYGAAVFTVLHIIDRREIYRHSRRLCLICAAAIFLLCGAGYLLAPHIFTAALDIAYTLLVMAHTVRIAAKFLPGRKTRAQRRILRYIYIYPAATVLIAAEIALRSALPQKASGSLTEVVITGSVTGYILRAGCVLVILWFVYDIHPKFYRAGAIRADPKEGYTIARGFTHRQSEIFLCVLRNQTSKDMAAGLYITEGTIRNHLMEIYHKAGVNNRSELMLDYLDYVETSFCGEKIGSTGELPLERVAVIKNRNAMKSALAKNHARVTAADRTGMSSKIGAGIRRP